MQHQIHVPIDDILTPAPITETRSSHERNLLLMQEHMYVYKYSFPTCSFSMEQITMNHSTIIGFIPYICTWFTVPLGTYREG